jgi:hypothetical protein
MKKTIAMIIITLAISSCSGYFSDISNDSSAGGLKTLALVGGGTLSDDAANESSPYLFRYNGKAYLFFSSDRSGNDFIYYSEMDADGRFHTPVLMDTSSINTSFYTHTSPVVFSYNGYIYLIHVSTQPFSVQMISTCLLDTQFNYISNVSTVSYFSVDPYISNIGMIQDPTNPKLLFLRDVNTLEVRLFQGGYWISNNIIDAGFPVESANGFSMDGMDYYILNSGTSLFGKRQIMGGIVSPMTNVFIRATDYISSYNDMTPFVDPLTYKVYFASDRYGKGNYDLYRYNTLTFNYFMSSGILPVFVPNIVYVGTNGNDANSGLIPSSPLLSINKAVAIAAANSYGFVFVSSGIYTPGAGLNPTGSGVLITNNIKPIIMIGGYDLSYSSTNSYTVLDGLGSLKHVVQMGNAMGVIMSGFLIRGGNANGSYPDNMGGGVLINNSAGCYIVDSMISNNTAINGGGVCLTNSMACSVQNSTISWNSATNGGGIYVDNQMNYFFSITNINNFARGYGGAFYFFAVPAGIIENCIITNDYSFGTNSVIYLNGGGSSPMLMISSNLIGGSNSVSLTNYAIYEEAYNSGFTLVDNTFITNRMNYLLRNFNITETLISNTITGWTNINNPVWTASPMVSNNTATNM